MDHRRLTCKKVHNRLTIHKLLCDVLDCDEVGPECHCYFQPRSNVTMSYPAIVYSLDDVDEHYANNGKYLNENIYQIKLIDKNPDSCYFKKIIQLPRTSFVRSYVVDNLHHWIFTIY